MSAPTNLDLPRERRMKTRKALRAISTVLVCAGVLVYVAAKIDFFRRYGRPDYLRNHGIYWILIAAIGLVLFLIERVLPDVHTK
jgi:hypothetical protein